MQNLFATKGLNSMPLPTATINNLENNPPSNNEPKTNQVKTEDFNTMQNLFMTKNPFSC